MAQSKTKVLHVYMLCLWLAVVSILSYQGYSLWKVVKYNYGIPIGYREVYDRKKQCKDTASGQFCVVGWLLRASMKYILSSCVHTKMWSIIVNLISAKSTTSFTSVCSHHKSSDSVPKYRSMHIFDRIIYIIIYGQTSGHYIMALLVAHGTGGRDTYISLQSEIRG